MKVKSGSIARERKDVVVRQCLRALGRLQHDVVELDALDRRVEVRGDLAPFDAVLDVGLDPVLDVAMQLRAAMDERDARSVTLEIQRRNRRGVLAADNDDIAVEVRMRLVVVVRDLRQVLAGNVEVIRQIVVAGGDDQLARAMLAAAGRSGLRCARVKSPSAPVTLVTSSYGRTSSSIVRRDLAVVLERFAAAGLLVR